MQGVAGGIKGRSIRISDVVSAEMDNFEPGVYSDRVLEAVKLLQTDVIPNFSQHVNSAAGSME